MVEIQRILCALDAEHPSPEAATRAAHLTRGSRRRLCYVGCRLDGSGGWPPFREAAPVQALGSLRRSLSRLTGQRFLEVPLVPASASGDREMLRTVRTFGADVIVVDCPQESRARVWSRLGRARRTIRHAPCSILLARRAREGGGVLAATDLSLPGLPVVTWGSWLATAMGAPLSLIHCLDVRAPTFLDPMTAMPLWPGSSQGGLDAARSEARRRMDGALEGLPGGSALVATGPPVTEILTAAERLAADVVVVGSRDARGIRSLLRSRVAERVAARASCSVLIVKIPSDAGPAQGH